MKLVVFIQVALLFVQLVNSSCESTLERCINTDCLRNNTVLEEIKQELCDIQDTECTDNPCKNGGTCINVKDTPVCQCPPEFVGKVCELDCTVGYEKVPRMLFNIESFQIDLDVDVNSKEECIAACTGDCTASFFSGSCFFFTSPMVSFVSLPIESVQADCKSICTRQTNSCRSYFTEDIDESTGYCLTFNVSTTDLPVPSTGGLVDIFNKITKCDISP